MNSPEHYMQQALALARRAHYATSPNPMVGCVIVQDGQVVGEGYHQQAGGPHAEVIALQQAGVKARGATMYVTLEPCCHQGRTGPCTVAVKAAGIAKVFAAMPDPNPQVSGQGLRSLQQAGIAVEVGLCGAAAEALNRSWCHYITTQTPWVIGKWALSLDGQMITTPGDDRTISNALAHQQVHQLRQTVDAIVVGANTVRIDNPQLTTRLADSTVIPRHPLRVIVSTTGAVPLTAHVLQPSLPGRTCVVVSERAPQTAIAALQAQGVTVWSLPLDAACQGIDTSALLARLGREGMVRVLVEGGPTLLRSLINQRQLHEVHTYIAPVLIANLPHKQRLQQVVWEALADNIHCTGDASCIPD